MSLSNSVLALDLSTHVGWARWRVPLTRGEPEPGAATLASGTFELEETRPRARRFENFRSWLVEDVLAPWEPSVVVYERPHLRGYAATKMLVALMAITEMECAKYGTTPVYSVHTGTLKKWATCRCHPGPTERCHLDAKGKTSLCDTGNGKASKADMIREARRLWANTVEPSDDNEADALCLLAMSVVPVNLSRMEEVK